LIAFFISQVDPFIFNTYLRECVCVRIQNF